MTHSRAKQRSDKQSSRFLTHSRAKQRSDKQSSRFLDLRTDDSLSADIVDKYIKEKVRKFTVEEVAVVDKGKEITTVELNRDESEEL